MFRDLPIKCTFFQQTFKAHMLKHEARVAVRLKSDFNCLRVELFVKNRYGIWLWKAVACVESCCSNWVVKFFCHIMELHCFTRSTTKIQINVKACQEEIFTAQLFCHLSHYNSLFSNDMHLQRQWFQFSWEIHTWNLRHRENCICRVQPAENRKRKANNRNKDVSALHLINLIQSLWTSINSYSQASIGLEFLA